MAQGEERTESHARDASSSVFLSRVSSLGTRLRLNGPGGNQPLDVGTLALACPEVRKRCRRAPVPPSATDMAGIMAESATAWQARHLIGQVGVCVCT